MKFNVMTLFPEMVINCMNTSIIAKAMDKGLLSLNAVDFREYTIEKHGKVDDYPYGGGAGMLIQAQPVYDAYLDIVKKMQPNTNKKIRTIYVTPQGRQFDQKMAEELAKEKELIILCGHYEGIDERVLEEIVTDYVSIGDYVLTGGELPAMVMIDSIARLIPGVLNNEISAETESFHNDLLEYPQYTRPVEWNGKNVPAVLLSGNHTEIMAWRTEKAIERTKCNRIDLYETYMKKKETIQVLLKKKRNHIYMIESLKRGNSELIYHEDSAVTLYDRGSNTYMLTEYASIEVYKINSFIFTSNQNVKEFLENRTDTKLQKMFIQACYTKKEKLPLKYKNIKLLKDYNEIDKNEEFFLQIQNFFKDQELKELKELISKSSVYAAYEEKNIIGIVSIMKNGSIGNLYVDMNYRRQGIGASLESYMINIEKELGWTPFLFIPLEDSPISEMQNKLGLYFADKICYFYKKSFIN